ncbi:MAG: type II secretion system F family protein [Candidatus Woesearchaeota archaeon]
MRTYKIPGAFVPLPILEMTYRHFLMFAHILEVTIFMNFGLKLQQARMEISARKYLAMCFANNVIVGIIVALTVFWIGSSMTAPPIHPFFMAFFAMIFIIGFLLFQQRGAPEVYIKKRVASIESNILPALQTILIQLRAGVPLFDIMVNTAAANYGEVSKEFLNVVKQINGGVPQAQALERMALENPSNIFRSAIWQMVNGMKTGTNLSAILREIMNELAEEQLIQVEEYGAQLSPLTMFYMIMAVIIPAIGVNFLIVLVAFMGLDLFASQAIFWGVYSFVFMIQIVFMGMIKSKRPNLLQT